MKNALRARGGELNRGEKCPGTESFLMERRWLVGGGGGRYPTLGFEGGEGGEGFSFQAFQWGQTYGGIQSAHQQIQELHKTSKHTGILYCTFPYGRSKQVYYTVPFLMAGVNMYIILYLSLWQE